MYWLDYILIGRISGVVHVGGYGRISTIGIGFSSRSVKARYKFRQIQRWWIQDWIGIWIKRIDRLGEKNSGTHYRTIS